MSYSSADVTDLHRHLPSETALDGEVDVVSVLGPVVRIKNRRVSGNRLSGGRPREEGLWQSRRACGQRSRVAVFAYPEHRIYVHATSANSGCQRRVTSDGLQQSRTQQRYQYQIDSI